MLEGFFYCLDREKNLFIHLIRKEIFEMKITETDKRIILNFIENFEIQNSDWGIDFVKRLLKDNPSNMSLTPKDKILCDWEE